MKILYIHPDSTELRESQCTIPIGIVGIINLLKKTNEIKGINIPIEKKLNNGFEIESYILEYKPKVILIDLQWVIYSYSVIELCRKIYQIDNSIKVIIGGITASIYYKEIMKTYDFVRFIIRGDSEIPYLKIIEKLNNGIDYYNDIPNLSFRKDNKIIHNEQTYKCNSLVNFNYYDYDFLQNKEIMFINQAKHKNSKTKNKLAWIPTGRGCKYNCSYCGGNSKMFEDIFKNSKMFCNEIDSIIHTITKLYKKYNINCFGITHDFSMFGYEYWKLLLEKIKKLNYKIGIYNYLFQLPNIDFINEYLKIVNEDTSIVGLPIVCGNEKLRIKNGKIFTNDQLFDFLNAFKLYKTKIEIYFIVNPYYGSNTLEDTLELIRKIKKEYKNKINFEISCGFEIIQPYSKKFLNKQTSLQTFDDYYYRYSNEFQNDLKLKKNINYLTGDKLYDKELYQNLIKCKKEIESNEY